MFPQEPQRARRRPAAPAHDGMPAILRGSNLARDWGKNWLLQTRRAAGRWFSFRTAPVARPLGDNGASRLGAVWNAAPPRMQRHVAGPEAGFRAAGFCFPPRIRHIGEVMTLATAGPRGRATPLRGAAAHSLRGAPAAGHALSLLCDACSPRALLETLLKAVATAGRGAVFTLVGLVCLALMVTPAAALDAYDGSAGQGAALLEMASDGSGRPDIIHAGHDHASPDVNSPDLHGAHHCCHSHVTPAQSCRSVAPIAMRHLTWRVGDSDGPPPRGPAPPLRPPRA